MKPIALPVAELKPALVGLSKVINTRSALPHLQHVKIERTSDGWIALTGADSDHFVSIRLEHPTEGPPATILLPFDQLSQVVKSCGKGETIEVDVTPENGVIRFPLGDTLGETKVPLADASKFPEIPVIQSETIPLPSPVRASIIEAMDCASNDGSRPVLNGAFIDTSNPKANYIVATDGRHLYSANSFALPIHRSILIPGHKFLGWKEFNADGEWQLKAGEEHIQLSTRRWQYVSKTIKGNYPDWRTPIPDPRDAKTIITLDPNSLETLIKLIRRMPCHETRHHTLGLEWQDSQLMLMGKENTNDPWLRVPVPDAKGEGPEVTIYVDRNYVEKALGFGLNTLRLIDPISPLRFSQGEKKQMTVMPVRGVTSVTTPTQPPASKAAAPPTTPPSAEQPTSPSMQTPTNGKHLPASTNGLSSSTPGTERSESKPSLEIALQQIESIKSGFRDGITRLTKVSNHIRQAMREQKASEKEIRGVRQTLRSLQDVRF